MDSTAMVGQMISLNQLDQLVSINSELGGSSTSTSSSSATSAAAALAGTPSAGATGASQTSSAQLVAAKNALLNDSSLAGSINPATLAASNPNATLDLSSFTNQFGGK
jgi:flagellar basal-body rod modification protein FlgD